MIPILHGADSTSWNTFGIGALADTIMCEVEENRNGSYELEMQYPITGVHFSEIVSRAIIVAKPNFTDDPQPFRIYRISKPLNGIVRIYARHISYDLSGYVDAPFTAVGIQAAMVAMLNNSYVYPTGCPFTFSSDLTGTATMKVKAPTSVRALMGGISGSLVDLYGGEWSYDGYEARLNAHRGTDRGVTIRYGKNLTELVHDENAEAIYTAVYPFYHNKTTDDLVTLPEKIIQVIPSATFSNVLALDLTDKFQEKPTEAQIRTAAQKYIDDNDLITPKVNITMDFVQAEDLKDRVDLCDTVHVYFDALGVAVSEKCIRSRWDTLKERYSEIEVGYARNSIAKTIAEVNQKTEEAIEVVSRGVTSIANAAASKITGNLGGNVVVHDADGDGEPDEILLMDTADIETAVHVIRMNRGGIAFSSDGYYGEYESAWNIDGEFVADFITAGTLSADMVKIIGDTNFYWDAGNIYIMDPTDSNRQIRIGLFDGEHYGIGFTRDGGFTWQTAIDFNGLHVEATGFAKVYLSQEQPTGTFNIGDIWIKARRVYTWGTIKDEFKWAEMLDYTWGDFGGPQAPNMYTWNGVNWQKTYDGESVAELSSRLDVADGRIDAQATAITIIDGRVTTNTAQIGIVGGGLQAEVSRATGAEDTLSSRITQTADAISTEVQKGLNGQGGYSSVYQTASQVRTTIVDTAYQKNTTVDISSDGVEIATGGHLIVDASNLEINADGTVSAKNAYLSGDVYSNNFPVLTRGGDIIVSSTQPSSGHAGMIWVRPDPSTSASSEYSFSIPRSWDNRLALYSNNRSGTIEGAGVQTSFTNCSYVINIPIYLRAHSGTPAGGLLKCVVSDGSRSITFTATVNESLTGTGDKVITMTAESSVWLGNVNNLSFVLSAEQQPGYYVYNILNSSDTSASITLTCTATGSLSGWVDADVKVYV